MEKYRVLYFQELGDERGNLVVAEGMKEIPFDIRRIFYMYGTKEGVVRGQHANRHSQFVLINLQGHVKIKVDDGTHQEVIILDKPHIGVYMDKMVWKDMYDFSADSILLVLSSHRYHSEEYIRDYRAFLRELK